MTRRYGRRSPKNARAIPFAALRAAGVLPAFPPTYDSIAGWTGWEMLGNDAEGDCVSVSWSTERRILTGGKSYPGIDQVITVYRTQNPTFDPNGGPTNGPGSAADGGMDIQTLLEYLVTTGGPDGVKAIAFAKVDHTSLDEMKAAVATFQTLWLGINVTDVNQQQFPNQPWTTDGTVEAGHSIIATGYDALRVLMETWASEASLADSYVTTSGATGGGAGVEEAWVVVWPEHAAGLTDAQKAALATAYTEVTGKTLVWPDAPPTPGPTPAPPAPGPVDADRALAAALRAGDWLTDWHMGETSTVRDAATIWLQEKGL